MASPEYLLQVAVVEHFGRCFPHVGFFHVPNQSRNATEAFFNKKLGVRPGVSDLILGWPNRGVGVLELKSSDGRISTQQNKFLSWANHIGWEVGTAKTVRQAHDALKRWGLKPLYESCMEPDLRSDEQKKRDVFNFYAPKGTKNE